MTGNIHIYLIRFLSLNRSSFCHSSWWHKSPKPYSKSKLHTNNINNFNGSKLRAIKWLWGGWGTRCGVSCFVRKTRFLFGCFGLESLRFRNEKEPSQCMLPHLPTQRREITSWLFPSNRSECNEFLWFNSWLTRSLTKFLHCSYFVNVHTPKDEIDKLAEKIECNECRLVGFWMNFCYCFLVKKHPTKETSIWNKPQIINSNLIRKHNIKLVRFQISSSRNNLFWYVLQIFNYIYRS